MRTVFLLRFASSLQGTQGLLGTHGFSCRTLELPWKQNARRISCIPEGSYVCKIRISPKFGRVYEVQGVPDRSFILAHSGNYAGSVADGYKSHVEGCILLGRKHGILAGQQAVLLSRPTVTDFMEHMHYEPFNLIIQGV